MFPSPKTKQSSVFRSIMKIASEENLSESDAERQIKRNLVTRKYVILCIQQILIENNRVPKSIRFPVVNEQAIKKMLFDPNFIKKLCGEPDSALTPISSDDFEFANWLVKNKEEDRKVCDYFNFLMHGTPVNLITKPLDHCSDEAKKYCFAALTPWRKDHKSGLRKLKDVIFPDLFNWKDHLDVIAKPEEVFEEVIFKDESGGIIKSDGAVKADAKPKSAAPVSSQKPSSSGAKTVQHGFNNTNALGFKFPVAWSNRPRLPIGNNNASSLEEIFKNINTNSTVDGKFASDVEFDVALDRMKPEFYYKFKEFVKAETARIAFGSATFDEGSPSKMAKAGPGDTKSVNHLYLRSIEIAIDDVIGPVLQEEITRQFASCFTTGLKNEPNHDDTVIAEFVGASSGVIKNLYLFTLDYVKSALHLDPTPNTKKACMAFAIDDIEIESIPNLPSRTIQEMMDRHFGPHAANPTAKALEIVRKAHVKYDKEFFPSDSDEFSAGFDDEVWEEESDDEQASENISVQNQALLDVVNIQREMFDTMKNSAADKLLTSGDKKSVKKVCH